MSTPTAVGAVSTNRPLSSSEHQDAIGSWLEELASALGTVAIHSDSVERPEQPTYATVPIGLRVPAVARVRALAKDNAFLTFAVLFAALEVTLSRYGARGAVLIGVPSRRPTGRGGQVGNVVPIVSNVDEAATFRDVLANAREQLLAAQTRQHLSFAIISRQLGLDRLRGPLVRVAARLDDIHDQLPPIGYDFLFEFVTCPDGLRATLQYRADAFSPTEAARLARTFAMALSGGTADASRQVEALDLLAAEDRPLLAAWNRTEAPLRDVTVHQLLEEQARARPEQPAVEGGGVAWSYAELDGRATALAHDLVRMGVRVGDRVGLSLDRTPEMVAAMFAILKAGAAYVPIDPTLPPDRVQYILRDSAVRVVLTDRDSGWLGHAGVATITIGPDAGRSGDALPVAVAVNPRDLAYVIYTSGSTGTPKGVMIEHRSVVNFAETMGERYRLGVGDRVLQSSSISFDVSVEEIFTCLTRGACLVLRDATMLESTSTYLNRCDALAVTFVSLPTTLWHDIVSALEREPAMLPRSLRGVVFGTERVLPERVLSWQRTVGSAVRLFHTYGPTEGTVIATAYDVPAMPDALVLREVPIGRPIRNVQVYVVDRQLQLAPIGGCGELCIGGAGLARGYINRPDLTRERFVELPLGPGETTRVYRTGDLVRQRADGYLEFLGRIDRQVKVRGFRVELSEIESTAARVPGVREIVVVPRPDASGNTALAAYVVADWRRRDTEGIIAPSELVRDHVREVCDSTQARYATESHDYPPRLYVEGFLDALGRGVLPPSELAGWADELAARVLDLAPRRLLEIGCGGSALVLLRVAPQCDAYLACDCSANALSIAKRQLHLCGSHASKVRLVAAEATDMGWVDEKVDTVLVAATTHHFPSIEYLQEVLARAIDACGEGGRLFISDVRDATLLDVFHVWRLSQRAEPGTGREELASQVAAALAGEAELAVDPAFFRTLARYSPRVAGLRITLKENARPLEYAMFHYDVTIFLDRAPRPASPTAVDWAEVGSLDALTALMGQKPGHLVVRRIPNGRIAGEVAVAARLRQRSLDAAATAPATGIRPEEALGAAAAAGVPARVRPSADNRGCFDLVCGTSPGIKDGPDEPVAGHDAREPRDQANDPLRHRFARELIPVIKRYLGEQLPSYMIPWAIVPLERLPLTHNGKVDVFALPSPHEPSLGDGRPFVAPITPIEEMLAKLFGELLGVKRVGRTDNFFDLGGHSLIALKLVSLIEDSCGVVVSPSLLYEAHDLAALAERLAVKQ